MSATAPALTYTTTAQSAPLWFPSRYVAADIPFSLSIAAAIGTDIPISGTVATAPSGTGELVVSAFTYGAGLLTVTPIGGQPTRVYTYEFEVTCLSGAVYTWTVQQGTLQALPTDTAQVSPDPGFGTPMTWTTAGPMQLVAEGLVGVGFGQSTALLLPAYSNIITSAVGYFILNGFLDEGIIWVQNQDPTHNATIYPPVGAQFIAGGSLQGVNVPFTVGHSGGQISFSTQASATLWGAA